MPNNIAIIVLILADVTPIKILIEIPLNVLKKRFLPIQSVYADIYVVDEYWPDFTPQHVQDAISWYSAQDITLGG